MNRNFKIIGAALLAAVMCASFAGCAKEEKKSELNESNIESHIESIFGGGSTSSDSSAKPEESEPEEVKLAMTDEIKNAALGSGLVQLNNDIFQRGGYMTAADFVEKYKESYDITYNCPIGYVMSEAGTYDECKDYLLEYHDEFFESRTYIGRHWAERENSMGGVYGGGCYYLKLTPKTGNSASVIAYVVNAVSPDEKITLDRAIVAEIESNYVRYEFVTPEWFPMGFNEFEFKDGYESENKNYTVKTLGEALEANGLKKNGEFEQSGWSVPSLSKAENFGTYWKDGDGDLGCYVLGEENLFGAKPLYYCGFTIDPNTDKLDYVSYTLEYFVKD